MYIKMYHNICILNTPLYLTISVNTHKAVKILSTRRQSLWYCTGEIEASVLTFKSADVTV